MIKIASLLSMIKVAPLFSRVKLASLIGMVKVVSQLSRVKIVSLLSRVEPASLLNKVKPASLLNMLKPASLLNMLKALSLLKILKAASRLSRLKIVSLLSKVKPVSLPDYIKLYYPGTVIACLVGLVAFSLGTHYTVPVMLFALLIGMAVSFLGDSKTCKPGVNFTASQLLRLGVGLLGARIAPHDIAQLNHWILLSIPLLIILTVGCGFLFSKFTGRNWHFAVLTAGAVGICGASAALAISSILPKAKDLERNTLFTVIAVTTLSTVAMISYPILFQGLNFSDTQIGYLIGATIHDVAQVVGAGYSVSTEVGDLAVLIKILRVTMLPIFILLAVMLMPKQEGQKLTTIPWFVMVFFALALLNSFGLLPEIVTDALEIASKALLIVAISALGIKSSLAQMAGVEKSHIVVVVGETLALLVMAICIALLLV